MLVARATALLSRLLAVALAISACSATESITEPFVDPPVTRQRTYSFPPGVVDRVAVMPFYPRFVQSVERGQSGVTPSDAGDLVARFAAEALQGEGIETVAPSDLESAFAAHGIPAPRLDGAAAAKLAASEFGATAVLLGEITRYRERSGTVPASVAFEMTLYTAPDGVRAWVSSFDETQRALSENIVNARRYPGRGTRWLSAAELARWGSESAIDALPARR